MMNVQEISLLLFITSTTAFSSTITAILINQQNNSIQHTFKSAAWNTMIGKTSFQIMGVYHPLLNCKKHMDQQFLDELIEV